MKQRLADLRPLLPLRLPLLLVLPLPEFNDSISVESVHNETPAYLVFS